MSTSSHSSAGTWPRQSTGDVDTELNDTELTSALYSAANTVNNQCSLQPSIYDVDRILSEIMSL